MAFNLSLFCPCYSVRKENAESHRYESLYSQFTLQYKISQIFTSITLSIVPHSDLVCLLNTPLQYRSEAGRRTPFLPRDLKHHNQSRDRAVMGDERQQTRA